VKNKKLRLPSKPGTLGDRPKPMTIRLDSGLFLVADCPRVTDAGFCLNICVL
jgi:hypothetical protein